MVRKFPGVLTYDDTLNNELTCSIALLPNSRQAMTHVLMVLMVLKLQQVKSRARQISKKWVKPHNFLKSLPKLTTKNHISLCARE